MDPLGLSIVVVNWNSREDLRECLAALDAQTDRAFETIVVDNGSTDGSSEMVASEFARVKLVQTGSNLGFAEGCNRGIAFAKEAWIVFLNNDAFAEPRFVESLRAAAKGAGDRVGMLQARIVFKQHPDRTNSTGIVLHRDGSAMDRDFDAPFRDDDRSDEIFCVTAGAAVYRRAMLDEVRLTSGFFDRDYFMYFEDVDLGWRARLAGWSAVYVPDAVVKHAFRGSSHRHGARFVDVQTKRNRLLTLVKNGSFAYLARSMPQTLIDLWQITAWKGPSVLGEVVRATGDAARLRREVGKIARLPRRAVETRWIGART